MTKPIKPSDVIASKPDQVFEVFNELIMGDWDGTQAKVDQNEAAEKIAEKMDMTISEVYKKKYLNIEEAYRQEGWCVYYDKPGYNEVPYNPYFLFSEST